MEGTTQIGPGVGEIPKKSVFDPPLDLENGPIDFPDFKALRVLGPEPRIPKISSQQLDPLGTISKSDFLFWSKTPYRDNPWSKSGDIQIEHSPGPGNPIAFGTKSVARLVRDLVFQLFTFPGSISQNWPDRFFSFQNQFHIRQCFLSIPLGIRVVARPIGDTQKGKKVFWSTFPIWVKIGI